LTAWLLVALCAQQAASLPVHQYACGQTTDLLSTAEGEQQVYKIQVEQHHGSSGAAGQDTQRLDPSHGNFLEVAATLTTTTLCTTEAGERVIRVSLGLLDHTCDPALALHTGSCGGVGGEWDELVQRAHMHPFYFEQDSAGRILQDTVFSMAEARDTPAQGLKLALVRLLTLPDACDEELVESHIVNGELYVQTENETYAALTNLEGPHEHDPNSHHHINHAVSVDLTNGRLTQAEWSEQLVFNMEPQFKTIAHQGFSGRLAFINTTVSLAYLQSDTVDSKRWAEESGSACSAQAMADAEDMADGVTAFLEYGHGQDTNAHERASHIHIQPSSHKYPHGARAGEVRQQADLGRFVAVSERSSPPPSFPSGGDTDMAIDETNSATTNDADAFNATAVLELGIAATFLDLINKFENGAMVVKQILAQVLDWIKKFKVFAAQVMAGIDKTVPVFTDAVAQLSAPPRDPKTELAKDPKTERPLDGTASQGLEKMEFLGVADLQERINGFLTTTTAMAVSFAKDKLTEILTALGITGVTVTDLVNTLSAKILKEITLLENKLKAAAMLELEKAMGPFKDLWAEAKTEIAADAAEGLAWYKTKAESMKTSVTAVVGAAEKVEDGVKAANDFLDKILTVKDQFIGPIKALLTAIKGLEWNSQEYNFGDPARLQLTAKARAAIKLIEASGAPPKKTLAGINALATAGVHYTLPGDTGTALAFTFNPIANYMDLSAAGDKSDTAIVAQQLVPFITLMDIKIPLDASALDTLRLNVPLVMKKFLNSILNSKALRTMVVQKFVAMLKDRGVLGGFFISPSTDAKSFARETFAIMRAEKQPTLSYIISLPQKIIEAIVDGLGRLAAAVNETSGGKVDMAPQVKAVDAALTELLTEVKQAAFKMAVCVIEDGTAIPVGVVPTKDLTKPQVEVDAEDPFPMLCTDKAAATLKMDVAALGTKLEAIGLEIVNMLTDTAVEGIEEAAGSVKETIADQLPAKLRQDSFVRMAVGILSSPTKFLTDVTNLAASLKELVTSVTKLVKMFGEDKAFGQTTEKIIEDLQSATLGITAAISKVADDTGTFSTGLQEITVDVPSLTETKSSGSSDGLAKAINIAESFSLHASEFFNATASYAKCALVTIPKALDLMRSSTTKFIELTSGPGFDAAKAKAQIETFFVELMKFKCLADPLPQLRQFLPETTFVSTVFDKFEEIVQGAPAVADLVKATLNVFVDIDGIILATEAISGAIAKYTKNMADTAQLTVVVTEIKKWNILATLTDFRGDLSSLSTTLVSVGNDFFAPLGATRVAAAAKAVAMIIDWGIAAFDVVVQTVIKIVPGQVLSTFNLSHVMEVAEAIGDPEALGAYVMNEVKLQLLDSEGMGNLIASSSKFLEEILPNPMLFANATKTLANAAKTKTAVRFAEVNQRRGTSMTSSELHSHKMLRRQLRHRDRVRSMQRQSGTAEAEATTAAGEAAVVFPTVPKITADYNTDAKNPPVTEKTLHDFYVYWEVQAPDGSPTHEHSLRKMVIMQDAAKPENVYLSLFDAKAESEVARVYLGSNSVASVDTKNCDATEGYCVRISGVYKVQMPGGLTRDKVTSKLISVFDIQTTHDREATAWVREINKVCLTLGTAGVTPPAAVDLAKPSVRTGREVVSKGEVLDTASAEEIKLAPVSVSGTVPCSNNGGTISLTCIAGEVLRLPLEIGSIVSKVKHMNWRECNPVSTEAEMANLTAAVKAEIDKATAAVKTGIGEVTTDAINNAIHVFDAAIYDAMTAINKLRTQMIQFPRKLVDALRPLNPIPTIKSLLNGQKDQAETTLAVIAGVAENLVRSIVKIFATGAESAAAVITETGTGLKAGIVDLLQAIFKVTMSKCEGENAAAFTEFRDALSTNGIVAKVAKFPAMFTQGKVMVSAFWGVVQVMGDSFGTMFSGTVSMITGTPGTTILKPIGDSLGILAKSLTDAVEPYTYLSPTLGKLFANVATIIKDQFQVIITNMVAFFDCLATVPATMNEIKTQVTDFFATLTTNGGASALEPKFTREGKKTFVNPATVQKMMCLSRTFLPLSMLVPGLNDPGAQCQVDSALCVPLPTAQVTEAISPEQGKTSSVDIVSVTAESPPLPDQLSRTATLASPEEVTEMNAFEKNASATSAVTSMQIWEAGGVSFSQKAFITIYRTLTMMEQAVPDLLDGAGFLLKSSAAAYEKVKALIDKVVAIFQGVAGAKANLKAADITDAVTACQDVLPSISALFLTLNEISQKILTAINIPNFVIATVRGIRSLLQYLQKAIKFIMQQASKFATDGKSYAAALMNSIDISPSGSEPAKALKQFLVCDRPDATLGGYEQKLLLSKQQTLFSFTFHVPPIVTFGIPISIGIEINGIAQLQLEYATCSFEPKPGICQAADLEVQGAASQCQKAIGEEVCGAINSNTMPLSKKVGDVGLLATNGAAGPAGYCSWTPGDPSMIKKTFHIAPTATFAMNGVVSLNAIDIMIFKLGIELNINLVTLDIPLLVRAAFDEPQMKLAASVQPTFSMLGGSIALVASVGVLGFNFKMRFPKESTGALSWEGFKWYLPPLCHEYPTPESAEMAVLCPSEQVWHAIMPELPEDRPQCTTECYPCYITPDNIHCPLFPLRQHYVAGVGRRTLDGTYLNKEWKTVESTILANYRASFAATGKKAETKIAWKFTGDDNSKYMGFQRWMVGEVAICAEGTKASDESGVKLKQQTANTQPKIAENSWTSLEYSATLVVRLSYDLTKPLVNGDRMGGNCFRNNKWHYEPQNFIADPTKRPVFTHKIALTTDATKSSGLERSFSVTGDKFFEGLTNSATATTTYATDPEADKQIGAYFRSFDAIQQGARVPPVQDGALDQPIRLPFERDICSKISKDPIPSFTPKTAPEGLMPGAGVSRSFHLAKNVDQTRQLEYNGAVELKWKVGLGDVFTTAETAKPITWEYSEPGAGDLKSVYQGTGRCYECFHQGSPVIAGMLQSGDGSKWICPSAAGVGGFAGRRASLAKTDLASLAKANKYTVSSDTVSVLQDQIKKGSVVNAAIQALESRITFGMKGFWNIYVCAESIVMNGLDPNQKFRQENVAPPGTYFGVVVITTTMTFGTYADARTVDPDEPKRVIMSFQKSLNSRIFDFKFREQIKGNSKRKELYPSTQYFPQLKSMIQLATQLTVRLEGKLRPCLPSLSIPAVGELHRKDWQFFGKPLTDYEDFKGTGQCFACTGNWWSNWELTCGRTRSDSSKHPISLPSRVGAQEFPWYPKSAATECGYTSCTSMDNMDRAVSRAFREESGSYGWDSAEDMPDGTIWVCGESTWTVKDTPKVDTPKVYEKILHSDSKDENGAMNPTLKCGYDTSKTTTPATINAKTPGSHYGGVLCVVLGTSTNCRQFRTGAGVLGNGVSKSTLDNRCSAWQGAYFETKQFTGKNSKKWEFLANQEYQQNRVQFEPGSSAYPLCSTDSGPMGADAGKFDDSKCSVFSTASECTEPCGVMAKKKCKDENKLSCSPGPSACDPKDKSCKPGSATCGACKEGFQDNSGTCVETPCSAAFKPENGKSGGANTKSGDTYVFECNDGYKFSRAATCTSGKWDSPICEIINNKWGKYPSGSCGFMSTANNVNLALPNSQGLKLQIAKYGKKKGMCIATYDTSSGVNLGKGNKNLGAIKQGGMCYATEECRYLANAETCIKKGKPADYNPTKPPDWKCMECKNNVCVQSDTSFGGCSSAEHRWK